MQAQLLILKALKPLLSPPSFISRWLRSSEVPTLLKSDYTNRKQSTVLTHGLAEATEKKQIFWTIWNLYFLSKVINIGNFIWCNLYNTVSSVIEICIVFVVGCLCLALKKMTQIGESRLEIKENGCWVSLLEDPCQKKMKMWTMHVTRTFWNRLLLENYPKEALSCLISKVAQKKNIETKVLMF